MKPERFLLGVSYAQVWAKAASKLFSFCEMLVKFADLLVRGDAGNRCPGSARTSARSGSNRCSP